MTEEITSKYELQAKLCNYVLSLSQEERRFNSFVLTDFPIRLNVHCFGCYQLRALRFHERLNLFSFEGNSQIIFIKY